MKYDAITIDTQTIEHNSFNFDGGLLDQLKQFNDGATEVIISQVVASEILRHLQAKTVSAKDTFDSAHKKAIFYGLKAGTDKPFDDEPDIKLLIRKRLAKFFEEVGAEIVPVGDVSAAELVKMYFQPSPPFANRKEKKNEFPDAIALLSLERWAKAQSKRILAVSNDGDWAAFAEKSDYIDVVNDLPTALQDLQDDLEEAGRIFADLILKVQAGKSVEIERQIQDQLSTEIENYSIRPEADSSFNLEDEYIELTPRRFDFPEEREELTYKIVQYGAQKIVASVDLIVTVNAVASFTLSVWDSIDDDYVSMGSAAVEKSDAELELTVLIAFEGDFKTEEIDVASIEIISGPKSLYVGHVGLDDQDDFYPEEDAEENPEAEDPLPDVP